MTIAIIGNGNFAKGLASVFAHAGFDVVLGSRDAEKGKEVAKSIGPRVSVSDVRSAAAGSDVVVLAVPYDAVRSVLSSTGDLAGKTVVDVTNPLTPDYAGLTIGHQTSAAEEIQKLAPRAHVVKAFNTLFAQILQGGGKVAGAGATVFIAGDNEQANDKVAEIATRAGLKPVKAGGLKLARYIEPVAGLNIALGYGKGLGTAIAPTWAGVA